ncbi:Alpha/Beta hydrolase protein [Gigaspora rosea]|uniref:Alpha/Beta hydrolase protein n=1 Tax=Gigaspora rosea TaxID=44941 RepID=A0A397VEF3_9GLOM|nr:Alpha/Beta hydrolase protein [Gigaspora rosea]
MEPDFFFLLPVIPALSSAVFKYYTEGPPKRSWDLKFHLTLALIKTNYRFMKLPVEQVQKIADKFTIKVPSNIIVKDVILDEEYKRKSITHLEKILKQYEDVLDEKWKKSNDGGLHGEWAHANKDDNVVLYLHGGAFRAGTSKNARTITFKLAELANSRVFTPSLRLAPQNQFPAALCDAIAAYLYLINPGPEAGFDPINPKKIVLSGDSSGGNLVFALLLFLRDAGLPLPVILFTNQSTTFSSHDTQSPWTDLTHSMPSMWTAELDKIDTLPSKLGFFDIGAPSPAWEEYLVATKALAEKIALKKPTIVSHPSFTEVPRFQLYCANEALAIPYVRQVHQPYLKNFVQVGGDERLRDETILTSYKAANPREYQLPSYATKNFEKSPFKNPTKVILEVYDDMPHGWHLLTFSEPSKIALERCSDFIKRVTSIEDNNISMIDLVKEDLVSPSISVSSSFIAMRINTNGEIRELNETDKDCLKWDKIGIVPKET